MKKLLSVLFILGSVAALANESVSTLPTDADPAFCFTNPCSAQDSFNVKVKVPEQLKITVKDIDFGLWCGTKTVSKDFGNTVSVEGEKDQKVKLGFKNDGNLVFMDGLALKFTGKVVFDNNTDVKDIKLDATTGKADAGLKVTINKPAIGGLLTAGKTYTASATVTGSYDGF
ncbi:MAG: hypothetical protein ACRC7S_01420 [Cetobacterium sp.]